MSEFEYTHIGGFMVDLFKTLGDLNRLRLLHVMMHQSVCVCELEVILEMTQSNVSRHLSKLKAIHALDSDKEAQWIHYSISKSFVKRHAGLIAYLEGEFTKEPVYQEDLRRLSVYQKEALTCQNITTDKEGVLKILSLNFKGASDG